LPPFLMTFLYGALVLGVLVFVHELGHFLVAKWLGVRVLSFSIGMGPRLFGFRRGETDYRISLLPLGGFVRMAGDNPEEERSGDPGEFLEKPWWVRALITVAGPLANLVFAMFLFFSLYTFGFTESDYPARVGRVDPSSVAARVGMKNQDAFLTWDGAPAKTMGQLRDAISKTLDTKDGAPAIPIQVQREGKPVDLSVPRADVERLPEGLQWDMKTVIGQVLIGNPAYSAGIREGDRIAEVDGHPVANWNDLQQRVSSHHDEDVKLTVARGKRVFHVTARTTPDGKIGIGPVEQISVRRTFPPATAAKYAVLKTVETVGLIYSGLWSFITNPVKLHESIAGPIAIAQVAKQQASGGFDQLVLFAAFISLALMAMNLLPIPILDGGHVFFALIEGIRKRPLSLKTQLVFQRIGLVVLVGLVVFSFYNDLNRVSRRQRAEADISKRLSAPASPEVSGSGTPDTTGRPATP
jgi:regulator of sigma E protease